MKDILVIALFRVTNKFPRKFCEKILFFRNERKLKHIEEPPYEETIMAIGVER